VRIFSATFTSILLIGCCQSFGQTPRTLTTAKADGGPVLTKYGYGDINKDSSLNRAWYTINDPTCPLQLVKAGVRAEQREGTSNLDYKPVVESFAAKEPITAMEMRFVLYDVFNQHIATLIGSRVEDVPSPGPFMFKRGFQDNDPTAKESVLPNLSASPDAYLRSLKDREKRIADETAKNPSRFSADERDVERLLTVVSFVSEVRTKSGTVWLYDPASVASEISKILHSKIGETTLEPKATVR
jgi:hypothetical protein